MKKSLSLKVITTIFIVIFIAMSIVGCNQETVTDNDTGKDIDTGKETEAPAVNDGFREAEEKLLELLSPLPEIGEDHKIAALLITLANPFWVTVKEGYEDAAREFGVSVDVLSAPKEDDVNSQLEALQTILTKDYNAVALSAITPYNLVPGVAEATKKNIPVIAVGTNVDEEAAREAGAVVEAFITSDFSVQGEMGAQFIIDKIGSGKVAVIEGMPGAAQGEARKEGAVRAFEANDNIEIVSVQPGNWDRNTAYEITSNIIQANPDLRGIFCANDVMALGAVEALQSANKKDNVVVVGVDFIDEARDSISEGLLDGTVAMSPYLFGKGGLILALKVLQGHTLGDDIFWTPLGLVHEDNVSQYDGWK